VNDANIAWLIVASAAIVITAIISTAIVLVQGRRW
jgi:hypothetical protein